MFCQGRLGKEAVLVCLKPLPVAKSVCVWGGGGQKQHLEEERKAKKKGGGRSI